ncbi:hypothetical protein FB451DRAFT_1178902 [Mycena latifolia]|nr:hypothetical protein FB451DRAFT_1178902 [Mycena latifolia]
MSHKRVRTKKIRNPSAHSTQTLGEEVAAVGADLNTLVEGTVGRDLLRGAQDVHHRENSPPGHRASDLDLAAKWGLPDLVQAAEGRRVTRGSRSTMPKRLEVSLQEIDASAAGLEVSRKVDASAVVRLEVSRKVDASAAIQSPVTHNVAGSAEDNSGDNTVVLSAFGELPWGNLPAVDRNVLQASHAPHVLRYELEEYMQLFQSQYDGDSEDSEDSTDTEMILAPVHTWDKNWTIATNKHGVKLGSGNKLNMNQLTVKPKFFPEWFDMSDEEESSVPQNAPELPNIQRMDLSILEDIILDMSDDEDIVELLSEYYTPAVHYTEDQQLQAAIIESLKDPKAGSLCTERRAGPSTLKLGAVIVEVSSETETSTTASPPQTPELVPNRLGESSKGKGVDKAEKDSSDGGSDSEPSSSSASDSSSSSSSRRRHQKPWNQKKSTYQGKDNFKPNGAGSTANPAQDKPGNKQGTSGKLKAKGPTLKAGAVKLPGLERRAKAAREANLRVGAIGIPIPEHILEGEWARAHSEDAGKYLVAMLQSYYNDSSNERFTIIDYGDAFEITDWQQPEDAFMVSRSELDDPEWNVQSMLAKNQGSTEKDKVRHGGFPSMGEPDNEYPALEWLKHTVGNDYPQ